MATLPVSDPYVDDSEFENVNGLLRRRPVPGFDHGALQTHIVDWLKPIAKARHSKVAGEWSLSDGEGHWLTPDVMMSGPVHRLTRRGHLWAPPAPHLVIEIRSVDQSIRELFDKVRDYRAYDVPFYWIVDPIERACYEALMPEPGISVRVVPQENRLSARDVFLECQMLWTFLDAENA
jgi:Uma2 family endonuclease